MSQKIEELHLKPLKIIQDDSLFKYGIDAVLLSDFASRFIRKNSNVIDLCTGNGIIPLILSKTKALKITGIEIQKECSVLAEKNVQLNKLQEKISIINNDIKNAKKIFPHKFFDFITCNPPYFQITEKNNDLGFHANEPTPIQIARNEIFCTINDVAAASFWLLKENGSLFLINRPSRLSHTLVALNQNKLYPKQLQFISPSKGQKPTMFLLQAVKSKKTTLSVLPELEIYQSKGKYSEELFKIYGHY